MLVVDDSLAVTLVSKLSMSPDAAKVKVGVGEACAGGTRPLR